MWSLLKKVSVCAFPFKQIDAATQLKLHTSTEEEVFFSRSATQRKQKTKAELLNGVLRNYQSGSLRSQQARLFGLQGWSQTQRNQTRKTTLRFLYTSSIKSWNHNQTKLSTVFTLQNYISLFLHVSVIDLIYNQMFSEMCAPLSQKCQAPSFINSWHSHLSKKLVT